MLNRDFNGEVFQFFRSSRKFPTLTIQENNRQSYTCSLITIHEGMTTNNIARVSSGFFERRFILFFPEYLLSGRVNRRIKPAFIPDPMDATKILNDIEVNQQNLFKRKVLHARLSIR